MSTKKPLDKRLDDLLAREAPPQPEPDPTAEVPSPVGKASPAPSTPPTGEKTAPPKGDSSPRGSTSPVGWDDYLNAIDRPERIGFTFDQDKVIPHSEASPTDEGGQSPATVKAPLQVGGEILGALQLEGDKAWSPEEQDLISTIAQQVSQHVENLRLVEQAQQYRTEAEAAARRLTHEGWENYLQTPDAPARGYVYDQQNVTQFNPSDFDYSVAETTTLSHDLLIREQAIGQLVVADPQEQPDTVADLLGVVADRLSTHIESLRLLDETERSRQQLDKHAEELQAVAEIATTISRELDPDQLLQSVVDLTVERFGVYHAHIYLINETWELLLLTAGTGEAGHQMLANHWSIPLSNKQSLSVQAALSGESVIENDVKALPGYISHPLLPNTRSELAVPLIVGEEVLGILNVQSEQVNYFNPKDVLIYNTLAAQSAVALQNSRLYVEQQATVIQLRELDHLKSAFLANMSHELRTPLNSIIGFTQVIAEGIDGPITKDMETDLGLITKNSAHLLTLINDILDMAKIEAGKVDLTMEDVELAQLLEDVIQTTKSLAQAKSLYLKLDNRLEKAMILRADSVRLRQIIINLIGNAVKFTKEGGVNIQVEQEENSVHIQVIDTGIGIPPDNLETIFEAFSQVDSSTTRQAGGTGLGLPISKKLVDLHGGRLWAESENMPGLGSTFHLILPLEAPKDN